MLFGTESACITLKWPNCLVEGTGTHSTDPNDHWRPWLEANVGEQHHEWDWDWVCDPPGLYYADGTASFVRITFGTGKEIWATLAMLKFG